MADKDHWREIGSRLLWCREFKGLTQKEFAERAGLERSQLKNWETGSSRLSLDGARALRRTYGLTLDFLIEGDPQALPLSWFNAWMARPRKD